MPIRAAVLLLALAATVSTAGAAPFDDLKADLAACLRFERDGAGMPGISRDRYAVRKCTAEIDRLERADPRRLRSDRGVSPSTRAVFDGVFGAGGRGRFSSFPN